MLVFICFGCDKDEEVLVKETLTYKVNIQDVNKQLEKVTFYTHTYYPSEMETIIYGSSKSNKNEINAIDYLSIIDSIMYSPEMKVYNGCTYYLEATFHFADSLNISSKTYVLQDTLTGLDHVTFIWPTDTIYF